MFNTHSIHICLKLLFILKHKHHHYHYCDFISSLKWNFRFFFHHHTFFLISPHTYNAVTYNRTSKYLKTFSLFSILKLLRQYSFLQYQINVNGKKFAFFISCLFPVSSSSVCVCMFMCIWHKKILYYGAREVGRQYTEEQAKGVRQIDFRERKSL